MVKWRGHCKGFANLGGIIALLAFPLNIDAKDSWNILRATSPNRLKTATILVSENEVIGVKPTWWTA
jgi:hypothetical protein